LTSGHARRRFPSSVYGQGSEPDPRFSLANERTFLAWIRTSMALLAATVALEALPLPVTDMARHASALLFAGLGILGTVQAWLGWMRSERAMRQDLPLPASPGMLPLSLGIILAVVIMAAGHQP
jgi:putative membrane protein